MNKDITVGAVKKALCAAFPERTHVITVQDWFSVALKEKYKAFSITIFKPEYNMHTDMPNPCDQYSGTTLREAFDSLMAKESELAKLKSAGV